MDSQDFATKGRSLDETIVWAYDRIRSGDGPAGQPDNRWSQPAADHFVQCFKRAVARQVSRGDLPIEEQRRLREQELREQLAKRWAANVERAIREARIPIPLWGANFETTEDGSPLVIDNGNKKAHKWVRYLADNWQPRHKGLTLEGVAGTGKTYLAMACLVSILRKHGTAINARYVTERELLAMYRKSYSRRPEDAYTVSETEINELFVLRPQILLLDDLGAEETAVGDKGDWARGKLVDLISAREASSLTTIVTTNYSIKEMVRRYDQRFVSRLYSKSPLMTIVGPDRRQRVAPNSDDPFAADAADLAAYEAARVTR